MHWVTCSMSAASKLSALQASVRRYRVCVEHLQKYTLLLLQAEPETSAESSMSTAAYLAHETTEKERAMELWQRIIKHEASHMISLKAGLSNLATASLWNTRLTVAFGAPENRQMGLRA